MTKRYEILRERSLDFETTSTEIYIELFEEYETAVGTIHTSRTTVAQFWDEELATQVCDFLNIREDRMSWPIGDYTTDERDTDEQRVCGEQTSEVAKDYVSDLMNKSSRVQNDWVDANGNKQYGWTGRCDHCSERSENLTVLKSATLSGVTVCKSCREGRG